MWVSISGWKFLRPFTNSASAEVMTKPWLNNARRAASQVKLGGSAKLRACVVVEPKASVSTLGRLAVLPQDASRHATAVAAAAAHAGRAGRRTRRIVMRRRSMPRR